MIKKFIILLILIFTLFIISIKPLYSECKRVGNNCEGTCSCDEGQYGYCWCNVSSASINGCMENKSDCWPATNTPPPNNPPYNPNPTKTPTPQPTSPPDQPPPPAPPPDQPPQPPPPPTNTPTPIITPFIKLKNTSFYSNRPLNQPMPFLILSYDGDDNILPYFIINSQESDPGIVSAPNINLGAGEPSTKNWKTTEASNNIIFSPSSFISYVKTQKNLKTITSIDNIENQNINNKTILINNNVVINDSKKNIFNYRNLVFLINGNLDIATNGNFTPINASIAFIVNGNINFSSNIAEARGIFIANSINTGINLNAGLKIIGNLIAQNDFINGRKQGFRPSVFIIFDQNQYLSLLPNLGITNYDWKQIQ